MKVTKIKMDNSNQIPLLFGKKDENLRLIEKELGVEFILRDNSLKIRGEEDSVDKAKSLIQDLLRQLHQGYTPEIDDLKFALKKNKRREGLRFRRVFIHGYFHYSQGKENKTSNRGTKSLCGSYQEE